jgi:A/G-specific adenine glycosylase
MDVGATFCRPRNPRCDACPARPSCLYAARVATEPAAAIAPERPIRLRGRTPQPAFESTSRWLRGRILNRLRDAPAGSWVELGEAPIGGHDARGIASALATLARDGLVELRPDAPASARLPLA